MSHKCSMIVAALGLALGVMACSLALPRAQTPEAEEDVAGTSIAQTVEAGVMATSIAQTIEAGVAATQASMLPTQTPIPPEPEAAAGETITVNMVSTAGKTLDDGWNDVFAQAAEIPAEEFPAEGVPFTLIVSEEQVEGYFALFSQALFVQDFMVTLDDGLIVLDFEVVLQDVAQPGNIVLLPSIDSAGDLVMELQSATMGQLSLPEESTASVTETLNEAMTGRREMAEYDVTLETLSVDDGQMVITGMVRPKDAPA